MLCFSRSFLGFKLIVLLGLKDGFLSKGWDVKEGFFEKLNNFNEISVYEILNFNCF